MTMIGRFLSIVGPREDGKAGPGAIPANDNDPKGPPPAAAAPVPHFAFAEEATQCSAMISQS